MVTAALRTVCLDVGEVVIDETRVWSTWARLVDTTPFTVHAAIGAAIVTGRSHLDALARFAPDWDTLEDEHEEAYGGFETSDVYGDVHGSLQRLRDHGLRVVLAGNQPRRRSAQLRALDLPVDDIVTSDELGSDKPAPAFFEALRERLEAVPSELLYVGDRVDNDVVPARAAGWSTAWLRRGPWGLLQALPAGVVPDLTVRSLTQLADEIVDARP